MLVTLFSDKNYRFSQWEFTLCSMDGKAITAACFLVLISREVWEEDSIIQHKNKDRIMRYGLNGYPDEDVLLLSGIFAGNWHAILIAEIQAFPERACEKSAILDGQLNNVKFLMFMFEPYYVCIIH
jgi:hypothetical protein